jgi:hypothetical protein
MTEYTAHDQLLTQLAALHDAALTTSDQQLQSYRDAWRKRWQSAPRFPRTSASAAASTQILSGWRALANRWMMPASVGAALVLLVISVHTIRGRNARVQIAPEPPTSRVLEPPAPAAATAGVAVLRDPCEAHVKATGLQPLIDDFEDGNPLIGAYEDRVGLWNVFKDTDVSGSFNTVTPTLLAQPTRGSRYALHAAGGELLNWGATVQLSFQPSCYDASVYSGIAFRAKGPGRVFVGVNETSVVPIQYGGTCAKDCYNRHQKKLDLSARWQSYTIRWNEMRQRGYEMPPLDPSRINGLSLLVQASDTPYDFWIDDLRFTSR